MYSLQTQKHSSKVYFHFSAPLVSTANVGQYLNGWYFSSRNVDANTLLTFGTTEWGWVWRLNAVRHCLSGYHIAILAAMVKTAWCPETWSWQIFLWSEEQLFLFVPFLFHVVNYQLYGGSIVVIRTIGARKDSINKMLRSSRRLCCFSDSTTDGWRAKPYEDGCGRRVMATAFRGRREQSQNFSFSDCKQNEACSMFIWRLSSESLKRSSGVFSEIPTARRSQFYGRKIRLYIPLNFNINRY